MHEAADLIPSSRPEASHPEASRQKASRRKVYHLIILVALALSAGRIAVVTSREGNTAFLSANDRSRWCTIASLVEHGTYEIDQQIAITDPIKRHVHPWQTIDKVRHLGRDGRQHHYSSKPPLFPTMVAGLYKVVNLVTGMTLTDQPIYLTRIILALVNLPLLAVYFLATVGSIERVGKGDWSRKAAAFGCCFGTMLLPFSVSLNNHLPAATATAVAMWIYLVASGGRRCSESHVSTERKITDAFLPSPCPSPESGRGNHRTVISRSMLKESQDTDTTDQEAGDSTAKFSPWLWGLAGVAATFAAANELPALSMTVFWLGLFAWLDRASILPFVIGAMVVAAGFFGTNWVAHQSLQPPYAHRGNGEVIATLTANPDQPDAVLEEEILGVLTELKMAAPEASFSVEDSDEEGRWVVKVNERQFSLLHADGGWTVAHWDDWYEYPGTYWKEGARRGVDRGEPSWITYLLHMTVGHHGLFSLTPLWLLVPFGAVLGLSAGVATDRRFVAAVVVATLVCLLFYLNRPLIDRNYGGVSVCFRWMLWFAPLWLVVSVRAMDAMERRGWRRTIVSLMLALSVFSVSASLASPWQSPWIYQFWQFLGWINV